MDKHIPAEQPDTRMHDPAANKRTIILISSISLLSFLPFLGSYGIIDPSDGLYAEGAREMVQSGNFLTPHFNFTPFYEKPILIYWLISAGYKIFGVSEFAARLPASLSGVLTAIAIYLFAAKYLGRRCAKICALVLLANPGTDRYATNMSCNGCDTFVLPRAGTRQLKEQTIHLALLYVSGSDDAAQGTSHNHCCRTSPGSVSGSFKVD
jgi:hypothetical protein